MCNNYSDAAMNVLRKYTSKKISSQFILPKKLYLQCMYFTRIQMKFH